MPKIFAVVAALLAACNAKDVINANPELATTLAQQDPTTTRSSSSSTQVTTSEDGTTKKVITKVIVIETEEEAEGVEGWVPPCELKFVSAVFGLTEVTEDAAKKYKDGQRTFQASTDEWGEGWNGEKKSLNFVYDVCGNITPVVVREGDSITLP